MSSVYVRDGVLAFIQANCPSENMIDITAQYSDIKTMITDAGLGSQDPWLGVQFVGSFETPVDIRATNNRGKYRENGIIYLHVVDIAKLGVHTLILNRAEAIRNTFRGQRIADTILIESVSPANFGEGISLNFENGYIAATIQIDYQRDLDL